MFTFPVGLFSGDAAGGPSWRPTALGADLLLWYGPDSTYSAGAWQDLSSGGRNTSQATSGLRPERVSAVLNGKPVTRFTSDWISCGAGWDYDDISVFVLVAPIVDINSSTNYSVMGAGASSSQRLTMFFGGTVASVRYTYRYAGNNGSITTSPFALANQFELITLESDTGASATTRLYKNDVSIDSVVGTVTKVSAGHEMRMGQHLTTAFTGSFTGDIFEYVVTRKLTEANRQKVAGYMLHNAGLQANLPSGHPYRTDPPTA